MDAAAAASGAPASSGSAAALWYPDAGADRNRNDLSVCPGEPGRPPFGERGDALGQLAAGDRLAVPAGHLGLAVGAGGSAAITSLVARWDSADRLARTSAKRCTSSSRSSAGDEPVDQPGAQRRRRRRSAPR